MTSISDTNVVNAPGGLVELAYYPVISGGITISATSVPGTLIAPATSFVSDGSPIIVEFFALNLTVPTNPSGNSCVFYIEIDGVESGVILRREHSTNTSASSTKGEVRLSLSAGVHTISVRGIRTNADCVLSSNVGTNSGVNYQSFLRISKIIQASQLIVQTPNAPLVTSLPSNAIDGQEVRYLADNTNGIIWNFRYRAGSSSTYKWEFIGGPPLHNSNGFYPGAINSASYVDVPSGANVTAPLDGDYMVDFNGKADCTSSQYGSLNNVAVMTATVAPSDTKAAGISTYTTSSGYVRASFSRLVNLDGVSAGETIKMQAKAAVGTVSIVYHYTGMSVTPIRVSA